MNYQWHGKMLSKESKLLLFKVKISKAMTKSSFKFSWEPALIFKHMLHKNIGHSSMY